MPVKDSGSASRSSTRGRPGGGAKPAGAPVCFNTVFFNSNVPALLPRGVCRARPPRRARPCLVRPAIRGPHDGRRTRSGSWRHDGVTMDQGGVQAVAAIVGFLRDPAPRQSRRSVTSLQPRRERSPVSSRPTVPFGRITQSGPAEAAASAPVSAGSARRSPADVSGRAAAEHVAAGRRVGQARLRSRRTGRDGATSP